GAGRGIRLAVVDPSVGAFHVSRGDQGRYQRARADNEEVAFAAVNLVGTSNDLMFPRGCRRCGRRVGRRRWRPGSRARRGAFAQSFEGIYLFLPRPSRPTASLIWTEFYKLSR